MRNSAMPPNVKILALMLPFIAASSCEKKPETNFRQTITNTTQFIENGMRDNQIVGLSIALVSDDRIVWSAGFGYADKENKIAATPDTIYMLGSGSKTLTTTALLREFDRGLVKLDDPVTDFLQDFELSERFANQMQGITVRRLLNHHSGLPGDLYVSGFTEEGWDDWGCDLFMGPFIDYLKNDYPSYPGGEIASYSNTGFVIAGELARRLGGDANATFNEYMTRNLLQPLEMNYTSFKNTSQIPAKGYIDGQPLPPMEANCSFAATGGAFTTVRDMAQFLVMILNDGRLANGTTILNPDTVALMGQPEQSPLDVNSFFQPGLGLDTIDDPVMRYAGRAWSKNGSTGHFNSNMEMLPDKKLAVIILTNSDTAGAFVYAATRECLKNAVLDKSGILPSEATMPDYISVKQPDQIVGKYVRSNGFDEINDNGDGTFTWVVGAHGENPEQRILQSEGDMFGMQGRTEKLVFTKLTRDDVEHFVLMQIGSNGSIGDESLYGGNVQTILGEKKTAPPISEPWQARLLKRYLVENISWNDLSWDMPYIAFSAVDDVLMVEHFTGMPVIQAQSANLAFVSGLSNRMDSCVRVVEEEAVEKVIFGGSRGVDIDTIPRVQIDDVVIGNVDFHTTDWYRFDAEASGKTILFNISGGGDDYELRLFDETLISATAQGAGGIEWTSQEGVWYLAISPTPTAPGAYTLSVKQD